MSRIVLSAIEGYQGRVILRAPLNLEQVFAIETAQDAAAEIEPSAFWTKVNELRDIKGDDGKILKASWSSHSDKYFLEAILTCAEKFEIEGIEENPTLENFPMTPRDKARDFVQLVWDELQIIYNGERAVPNES